MILLVLCSVVGYIGGVEYDRERDSPYWFLTLILLSMFYMISDSLFNVLVGLLMFYIGTHRNLQY